MELRQDAVAASEFQFDKGPPIFGLVVPCRSSIYSECFGDITGCVAYTAAWWSKQTNGQLVFASIAHSHIVDARNQLSKGLFQYGVPEWVGWLDDDSNPPADVFQKLAAHNKDIVVPAFCRRRTSHRFPGFHLIDEKGAFKEFKLEEVQGKRELIEVGMAGMHCVLMRGRVLREVIDTTEGMPFQSTNKVGTASDLFFWQIARARGFTGYLDPTIKCGHSSVERYDLDI